MGGGGVIIPESFNNAKTIIIANGGIDANAANLITTDLTFLRNESVTANGGMTGKLDLGPGVTFKLGDGQTLTGDLDGNGNFNPLGYATVTGNIGDNNLCYFY